jgi:hypothetical protein
MVKRPRVVTRGNPLTVPPVHFMKKILERYEEQVEKIGYLDALINYKNSMQNLYIKYNPDIKRRFINKDTLPYN